MKRRKPNNMKARMERSSKAVLRTNHVAVLNIDPEGRQFPINMKNGKWIGHGERVATAIHEIAHQWTVYFSFFCEDQFGVRYIKSAEIATSGMHKADSLTDVIEHHYKALRETCNPNHIAGSAWIANPCGVSLSEEQAAHIYDVTGAWAHVERTQAA